MLVVLCVVLAHARCRRVVAGFWGAFVAQTTLSGFPEPPPSVLVSCGKQVGSWCLRQGMLAYTYTTALPHRVYEQCWKYLEVLAIGEPDV